MKVRTKGLLFVFAIATSICATVFIGILGGYAAKSSGDPNKMPSPYPELFYLGMAVTSLLMYAM